MDRNRGLDINALRQQLEDLLEDFLPSSPDRRRGGRGGEQTQHLPLNVAETDEAFTLTAPLPGFQPEDVDITVRGQNVTLRAQHKNPPAAQQNLSRHEWGQGVFQRSFELPDPVEADQTTATFRQGVVTVTLPKAAPSEVTVEAEEQEHGAPEPEPSEATENTPAEESAETQPEAAPSEKEKSSFYMAPGRGRRGRRHGRNAEQAPAEEQPNAAEEQSAGIAEGESQPQDAAAPADEEEARRKDREEQSGSPEDAPTDAVDTADTPEDVVVAETLDLSGDGHPASASETAEDVIVAETLAMGGATQQEETPAPEAADAAADTFAEESERAAEPPTE